MIPVGLHGVLQDMPQRMAEKFRDLAGQTDFALSTQCMPLREGALEARKPRCRAGRSRGDREIVEDGGGMVLRAGCARIPGAALPE